MLTARRQPLLILKLRSMNRFQWTVGGLLLAMLVLAVGRAALIHQSPLVAQGTATVYALLLCLALTGAICGRGTARSFWVGCFVFGAGYGLVAAINPSVLVTESALQYLPRLRSWPAVGDKVMARWTSGSYYPATIGLIQGGQ
jgi:hypothetical protein